MPVTVRKVKGGYRVSTPNRVHARRTSLRNARRQRNLLNAVEHNPEFTPRRSRSRSRGRRVGY